MGLLKDIGGDVGVENLGSGGGLGLKEMAQTLGVVFLVFFIIVIVGIITFYFYSQKIKKQQFKYKIHIFKDIAGEIQPIDYDVAKEVFVPDTNVGLYYLLKKKIYIARPTRAMGKDAFWFKILPNGEWVNFDLKSIKEKKGETGKQTLADADYDHRDTRYAYINLKEIIKRNYRDKSVKWWKEYAPLITFIVVSFIFLIGSWLLLAKIGKLIDSIIPLMEVAKGFQDCGNSIVNSGVAPA